MLYIFDLGNVIVDIDFNRVLGAWSDFSRVPLATLKQNFAMGETFHLHERGEISDERLQHAVIYPLVLQLPACATDRDRGDEGGIRSGQFRREIGWKLDVRANLDLAVFGFDRGAARVGVDLGAGLGFDHLLERVCAAADAEHQSDRQAACPDR